MIKRHLENKLASSARNYPVLTVTGPRQSGKTTLVRKTFPKHAYVSLENPDDRKFALEDPRGFLNQFQGPVILDEVQRTPDILSFLQERVDKEDRPGQYVLTGSQNFLLMEKVTQSLAGRTAIFKLLPFSRAEITARKPLSLSEVGRKIPAPSKTDDTLFEVLYKGFYPRIHDKNLDPQDWLGNYYQTYIERDIRSIVEVGDLEAFGRFVRLCAGRTGQILNLSSLGADCGISHTTARRWLSVLETSFIVYLLRPHYKNFSRRLIKSPKLYFLDTGLLCYLLRIRTPKDLVMHASRGAVFENYVLGELLKAFFNQGREADVYFWRDVRGHEIDFILEQGSELLPIEAKSGETIASDYTKGLLFWRELPGQEKTPVSVVYGGHKSLMRSDVAFYSWNNWL